MLESGLPTPEAEKKSLRQRAEQIIQAQLNDGEEYISYNPADKYPVFTTFVTPDDMDYANMKTDREGAIRVCLQALQNGWE